MLHISTAEPAARSNSRSPTALGISMLLLLLSAIPLPDASNTFQGVQNEGDYPNFFGQNTRGYTQTPYLAYVASFASGEDVNFNEVLSLGDDDDDSSRQHRQHHGRRSNARHSRRGSHRSSPYDFDSSDSDSDDLTAELLTHSIGGSISSRSNSLPPSPNFKSNNISTTKPVVAAPLPAIFSSSTTTQIDITSLPKSALKDIMQFLNLADLQACRKVSQAFRDASEAVASTKIPGFTFVKFNPATPCAATKHAAEVGSSWECAHCSLNNMHMSEVCHRCKTPNGNQRVFLGQLRKEKTSELVHYILRMMLPEVKVVHVESHTNPIDGRGKGCAWVYVSSQEDAQKVLTLNKRIFVDYDGDFQHEGIWVAEDESKCDDLAGFAAHKAYSEGRPHVLPRQCIVAEIPKKSAASSPSGSSRSSRRRGGRKHKNNNNADTASSNGHSDDGVPTPTETTTTTTPRNGPTTPPPAPLNYHKRSPKPSPVMMPTIPAPPTPKRRVVTAEHYLPDAPSNMYASARAEAAYNCAPCTQPAHSGYDYNTGYNYNYSPYYSAAYAPRHIPRPAGTHCYAEAGSCNCEQCRHFAW